MRRGLLIAHRCVGLVLAGFLLVAGLTGAMLAWNDELEALISPQLFLARPGPGADVRSAAIDPLLLRERVLQHHPHAQAAFQPLRADPGRTLMFFLTPRVDPATGRPFALASNHVFANPYTGLVQGERNANDLWQGATSLMPFVYRLHHTLELGRVGSLAFGIVAVLWTLDCFVGILLTLPARGARPSGRARRPWLSRWWPSWTVRWQGGAYKLNFDLHRAGGLWTWVMLLVLAWSSVALSMPAVYDPVMRAVFAYQPGEHALPRLAHPRPDPAMGWVEARATGRALMAQQAARHGLHVLREEWMFHDAARGVYRYAVTSDRDIGLRYTRTLVLFDADTGALKGLWLPTGAAAGDTVSTWLTRMHMAAFGGLPFKVLLSLLGLAVAGLSATGLWIWWRKRKALRAAGP